MNGLTLMLTAIGLVLFLLTRSIYRLYFHPLHRIPGPRVAAITQLYEFYFDVFRQGKYIWEVERMHRIYGRHCGIFFFSTPVKLEQAVRLTKIK